MTSRTLHNDCTQLAIAELWEIHLVCQILWALFSLLIPDLPCSPFFLLFTEVHEPAISH